MPSFDSWWLLTSIRFPSLFLGGLAICRPNNRNAADVSTLRVSRWSSGAWQDSTCPTTVIPGLFQCHSADTDPNEPDAGDGRATGPFVTGSLATSRPLDIQVAWTGMMEWLRVVLRLAEAINDSVSRHTIFR